MERFRYKVRKNSPEKTEAEIREALQAGACPELPTASHPKLEGAGLIFFPEASGESKTALATQLWTLGLRTLGQ